MDGAGNSSPRQAILAYVWMVGGEWWKEDSVCIFLVLDPAEELCSLQSGGSLSCQCEPQDTW